MLEKLPSQSRWVTDRDTGRRVRQVTDMPCINHHPFFLAPAWNNSQRYLIFVSWRTGRPELYAEDAREQNILRLTEEQALDEWSVHPSDEWVYYVAGHCAMRANLHNGSVETLLNKEEALLRFGGVLGEGTTALTRDGRRWAVRIRCREDFGVLIRDNAEDKWRLAWRGPMVAHLQFCPDDPDLLFCAGVLTDRVWVLDLKTDQARRIYSRDAQKKQWITHESWIPGTRELSLVDWPHGVLGVQVDTGMVRRVAAFNAWHAISNDQGTRMAADTNFPDTGKRLWDPRRAEQTQQLLCCPHATCKGAHWADSFPYDNGPIRVDAPQHTHPHPRFSPDGKKLVYTSDASGYAQIYEIEIPK